MRIVLLSICLLSIAACSGSHHDSPAAIAPTIQAQAESEIACYPLAGHGGHVKLFPARVVDARVAQGSFCLVDGVCYYGCAE